MRYPHHKVTPFLLASFAKQYFRLHRNLPKGQMAFLWKWLNTCISTDFGKAHHFDEIATLEDFQRLVPVQNYDTLYPWIERCMKEERDVLIPGLVKWFATSSGTTGKSKYIPVTLRSLRSNHFKAATEGFMHYVEQNSDANIFAGQNITIGGGFAVNPYTGKKNVGFISAIFQKHSPIRAKWKKQPKAPISYLLDRNSKVEKMLETTITKDITSIAGQPSWCSQFLRSVLERTGKKSILEVWPNFQLVMRGGMSIDLYKETFAELLPSDKVQYYQVYNASEGFFAMQHENGRDDMLLFINHSVFYEFIPLDSYLEKKYDDVYTVSTVQVGIPYVILVTTNAGLRRYILGDTVMFTGLDPYTLKIIGRTKYYLDVAGECITLQPLQTALYQTAKKYNITLEEFTVGPGIFDVGKGRYEWIISVAGNNKVDSHTFALDLDKALCEARSYYADERHDTHMLIPPVVHFVDPSIFYKWLETKGKLGGQHKIPKVSNTREMLEELLQLKIKN